MNFPKALIITAIVLVFHGLGLLFHLYDLWAWYDIPLHFGGGLAMAALGLALWQEGISGVTFKGVLARHLDWWLVPLFVIGFVSLISVLWEMHEFLLDVILRDAVRQPDVPDTMADFFNDLSGGLIAIAFFYRR